MRWPRIIFLCVLGAILFMFGHYTLPQRDVVRIVDAQPILTSIDGWSRFFYAQSDSGSGTGASVQRDVRIISAVRPDGSPIDYRNEDTGIGWPPYFKFDSQDLQTEAQDLRSTRDEPVWVAVTHYGWRNNLLSSYPNALSIRPVEGPDVTLIPWMPVAILVAIGLLLLFLWRVWDRFQNRVLSPATDGVAVRWAKAKDRLSGRG